MSQLALDHITVIDLTRVRSGPTCVRQLADMGANVVQVTSVTPDGATPMAARGSDYQNLHRNKRSISLDLKDERGREALLKLVEGADVLVENYRPDVKRRLRIDYETLSAINPRLIYGSISGFGEEGPYRNRPGFDQIAQGMGGLMAITGESGQGPMRAGIPVADLCAGLYLAQGILVALLERERSGKGQWITTSLLQAMVNMLDFQATRWTIDGEVPPQAGNDHPTTMPTSAFRTKDGHINIAATAPAMWSSLCEVAGVPELADDPRFDDGLKRSQNRDELKVELERGLVEHTSDELIERLNERGVPAGPILAMDEVFADEQVRANKSVATVEHRELGELSILGVPYTMSRTPGSVRTPTPDPGQHTDEVLRELGYTDDQLAALHADGVV
jgi:formyl-CoA transferase